MTPCLVFNHPGCSRVTWACGLYLGHSFELCSTFLFCLFPPIHAPLCDPHKWEVRLDWAHAKGGGGGEAPWKSFLNNQPFAAISGGEQHADSVTQRNVFYILESLA